MSIKESRELKTDTSSTYLVLQRARCNCVDYGTSYFTDYLMHNKKHNLPYPCLFASVFLHLKRLHHINRQCDEFVQFVCLQ